MSRRGRGSSLASRTLTILAAAFLAFDGAGLFFAGLWLRRPLMAIIGTCLFGSSALVFVYWRWHRRQVSEIDAARLAVAAEARALRELVQRN